MGLVYLALQKQPVRRPVALKIIKPGMDSKAVIARFEAERQALALLDHPNIARVYDANMTDTGRPYFAMEYVRGKPITHYCDAHQLSIEQRLRLFEQICEAVHHAHQKGIIHRDLKPSNILVSLHDDRIVPKIIDFGIAKAMTQPLTEKTLITEQGQLLGTPEYMSPEQVDMVTQDIDIRSDIYSLGIVLYELLVGVLPFTRESLPQPGLAELRRTIQQLEPMSPSTMLTRLGSNADEIAVRRQTQVALLARRLRRELEWIPLKAIRKERSRRYRSASEMADDIRNYLHGLPLIAGPETTLYRLQKFVSKHSGTVATVAIVAIAIILGILVSTSMYMRAEKALEQEAESRSYAEKSEKRAQEQRRHAEHLLARAQIERGIKRINEADFYGLLDLIDAYETAREIPDLRIQAGRLWAVAYEFCRDRLVHVLPGGSNVIYSPDGKLLAVGQILIPCASSIQILTGHMDHFCKWKRTFTPLPSAQTAGCLSHTP
jgi:serine/threonine protein kinase